MSYVYLTRRFAPHEEGMGYLTLGGSCSTPGVRRGVRVCYRGREQDAAERRGCEMLPPEPCTIGSDSGFAYCCPPAERAPAPTPEPETGGGLTDIFASILGTGTPTPSPVPGLPGGKAPGTIAFDRGVDAPASGKGVAQTAAGAAVEAAEEEEDRRIPFQETPDGAPSPGSWLQEHAVHITIASTVVGLLTFIGWVLLKPKQKNPSEGTWPLGASEKPWMSKYVGKKAKRKKPKPRPKRPKWMPKYDNPGCC